MILNAKRPPDMRRRHLYYLLFIICYLSFPCQGVSAHGRVEEAFRALLAANRHPQPYDDEGQAPAATWLLLPLDQMPLILDVYKAMEEEHAKRTIFFRQDFGSACANGIELQGRDFKYAGLYNNILGGFTDPSTSPTTYHWYYLAWRPDPDAGNIVGYIVTTQQVANTPQPNVQEPREPSYQTLLTAIRDFKDDFTEASDISALFVKLSSNFSRHSDFEARSAATGQWIYQWKTFGFSLPFSAEQELIAPLYRAFLEVQPRAYRFLNKRAGETAEDVQIVVNNQGKTIGLGLQTDWNIIYAYFNDEDFPQNRYVYALWYKLDVPSQRIVGELIEVNTPRPNGGQVVPSVQMSVPAYLYSLRKPITTNNIGALNNVSQNEATERRYSGVVHERSEGEWETQQRDEALSTVLAASPFTDNWRERGFDREAFALEYESITRRQREERALYNERLRHYTDFYNTVFAGIRATMQASLDSVKAAFVTQTQQLNLQRVTTPRDDYERRMTALFELYRQQLDTVTAHYQASLGAITSNYETGIRDIAACHPVGNTLITGDGDLTPFGQRLFEQMTNAYHGYKPYADMELSLRIQVFARTFKPSLNAATRSAMAKRLRKISKRGDRRAAANNLLRQSADVLLLK